MTEHVGWGTGGGHVQFRSDPNPEPMPDRPRPHVDLYSNPSDGSTLILCTEPVGMTYAQVVTMAQFNSKPRYR